MTVKPTPLESPDLVGWTLRIDGPTVNMQWVPPDPPRPELDFEASNLLAHATRGKDVEERQLR